MKKRITFLGLLLFSSVAISQQAPTNNNPSLPSQNGINDRAFWLRAGNSQINGSNNIFGTLWNSPIYTQTNSLNRMRLNGNINQTISVYTANNLNGYLGLGTFIPAGGTNYWNNNSPFSQLHIAVEMAVSFKLLGSSMDENRDFFNRDSKYYSSFTNKVL